MKNALAMTAFTIASAGFLSPVTSAAQAHVQVTITDEAPRDADGHYHARDSHATQYRAGHAYAPSARYTSDGSYVAPRRWIDRDHDGMDDRRGRRDLDRDGIRDRDDPDLDNDGIANRYDNDIDGDGVRNRRDRRPDNPLAY